MVDIKLMYLFLGGFTIFAFLIGAAAGWWLGGRSGSKRRSQPVEKPVVTTPKSDPTRPEESSQSDPTEILRFVREPGNGALVMKMRGKVYRRSEELTDLERENLMRFGQDWLKWLGAPTPQQTTSAETDKSVHPQPEAESPSANSEPWQGQVSSVQSAAQPRKSRPLAPAVPVEDGVAPLSIVAQIDEILQELLPLSSLANKTIKLTEDPNQGVAVWVDNQCFFGVDSVPDPDVRALLRKAAQEWEKRSG